MARAQSALIVASLLALSACAGELEPVDRLIADGQYAAAEEQARERLARLQPRQPVDSLAVARVLDRLVLALFRGGKTHQAETLSLAERALRIKEALLAGDDPELCVSLDQFAGLLGTAGEHERAIALHSRSLAIRETAFGADALEVSWTLNYLAPLLWEIGDYAAARPLYERALAIRRRSDSGVDGVLNNLGVLAYDMGDYASARRYYHEALQIRRADNPHHPQLPGTLVNLALVHWREHDLDEAKRLATAALALQEGTVPAGDEEHGIALFVLGDIEASLGQPRRALPLYENAIRALGRALGQDHPFLVRPLLGFAAALRQTADFDASREQIMQAVAISSQRLGDDHPYTSASRSQLAAAMLDAGDTEAGLRLALLAEAGGRRHLRLTSRSLAERQSLHYASVRSSGLDVALTLAAGELQPSDLDQVVDAVIRSRAVVLDELVTRRRLLARNGDPEVERLSAELTTARTRLANLMVRGVAGDPQLHADQLAAARVFVESAESRLALASAPFRQERVMTSIGLAAVRRDLPARSALVSLIRYGERRPRGVDEPAAKYLALVLRDGRSIAVPLAAALDIDALIGRWREEVALESASIELGLAEAEGAYRKIGTTLRERVWDPIAAELDGVDLVFVVPDGTLHTVNLATLPTHDGGYLVEAGPRIHYLSAERDLVTLVRPASTGEGLLAMGAPDFDLPDSAGSVRVATRRETPGACRSFDFIRFGALPEAGAEIGEVTRAWKQRNRPGLSVFTGPAATEASFKQNAPGKRFIHVATHGFFLGQGCGAGSGPDAELDNPLALSGLAFAGANLRSAAAAGDEDGVLTAEEITALDLHDVEWVVLSACDTGLGEIRDGEGVLGLRRALKLAGARTLIMSLWSVDDAATRNFMAELYRRRMQGASTVDAVRQAGLAGLVDRRRTGESTHPFFWGAFVATGGWN